MFARLAALVLLAACLAVLPVNPARAAGEFVFHPESSTCTGVPDAQEVEGSWQMAVAPESPHVGDSATMSLRGSGASLQVTLIFVGTDGEVIDLLDGNAGDGQVAEFTKPVTSVGVYTTVWAETYSGRYIACGGFVAQS